MFSRLLFLSLFKLLLLLASVTGGKIRYASAGALTHVTVDGKQSPRSLPLAWEIYDSVFPAGTRWDEEKLQLLSPCCLRYRWLQFFFSFLKVAMNQPMKGLMCFIWPKLFFLLGGPFTLQRKRK